MNLVISFRYFYYLAKNWAVYLGSQKKFGVAPGVYLLQTANIRPRQRILQAQFESAHSRNNQIFIQGWCKTLFIESMR